VVCTTLEVTVCDTPEPSVYVAEAWLLIEVPAGGGVAWAALKATNTRTPAATQADARRSQPLAGRRAGDER